MYAWSKAKNAARAAFPAAAGEMDGVLADTEGAAVVDLLTTGGVELLLGASVPPAVVAGAAGAVPAVGAIVVVAGPLCTVTPVLWPVHPASVNTATAAIVLLVSL